MTEASRIWASASERAKPRYRCGKRKRSEARFGDFDRRCKGDSAQYYGRIRLGNARGKRGRRFIEKAAARDANIIFGASIKEDLEDEIRITVIAAGFDDDDTAEEAPQEPETSVHHASPSASAAKVEEAAAETVGEAQPELPADDDIEVPEF